MSDTSSNEIDLKGVWSGRRRFQRLSKIFAYRSIRFRLAATFVVIFGTTLILFGLLMYQVFVKAHQQDFDAALFNHAVDVAQAVDVDFFGDLTVSPDSMSIGAKVLPFSIGRSFLQIRTMEGKILGRSSNLGRAQLPYEAEDGEEIQLQGAKFKTVPSVSLPSAANEDHSSYRMIMYLINRPRLPKLVLQIAVPTNYLDRDKSSIRRFLIINIPLTLIVAMFGGLYLSRRALAPVGTLIERTQQLTASRLADRVPIPSEKDEIQALALTINGLLDRLQRAFQSQERFIADASHQLRTPLSILRGEIDVFRGRERTREEMMEFLASSSQEIDHLSRMVQDLLVMARVDAGQAVLTFQPVRLDEQLLEIVARLEKFADRSEVRLRVQLDSSESAEAPEIYGDSELIQVMLQNLVENAIKYSPRGKTVQISMVMEAKNYLVLVEDEGRGIPPDALDQIFERFHRVTSSEGPTGAGLGLAITRKIAEAHRGSVTAENRPQGGARFCLRMPRLMFPSTPRTPKIG